VSNGQLFIFQLIIQYAIHYTYQNTKRTSGSQFLFPPNYISFYFAEPSVKVHPLICGQTLGVDREIFALLNGVTVSELWDCQLILVFCPIASRAGTDIEDALRKIPGN